MTIHFFRKLYKLFSFGLFLTPPLFAYTATQEVDSCKAALWAQINEQKRVPVSGCPVSEKLIYWLGILRDPHQFTPQELITFLTTHTHWPRYEKLCRKAEEVISTKGSTKEIMGWFEHHPPQTPEGAIAYGKTLLAQQHKEKALKIIGEAWKTMSLTQAQEKEFRNNFGFLLTKNHYEARLDHLIWNENHEEAKRLIQYVPGNEKKVAHLRLSFLGKHTHVHQQMRNLPPHLQSTEGFLYDQAKWFRKNKKYLEAAQILVKAPINALYAQKWWKEQNYIARELMALGEYGAAYKIVQRHKVQPGVDEFAEAEWLAGWLALRFLNKPDVAMTHFKTLTANVKGAISKARGAYWMGRAYEKIEQPGLAAKFYAKAAHYKTTYYGQLAAAKIKQNPFPTLSAIPCATKEEKKRFEQNELVKAAHILKSLGKGAEHDLRKFLLQIAEQSKTKAERELSVHLAQLLSPEDVVWVAKKAGHREPVLLKAAFPICSIPRKGQEIPEVPLVMAVAYQESRFVPSAVSSADAIGLLQLLETTAVKEAKRLGIAHTKNKLFDPHHNLILGSAHLSRLLKDFMGSYILTFAAYNAGPTPVFRWIKEFGDPRSGEIDIIDWVERIPYAETRNYVMRVLENVTTYRSVLLSKPSKTLVDDLKR